MEKEINIRPFLEGKGKITQLPKKLKVRLMVLAYLAEKFEKDRDYTEQEINAVCDAWHTFGDFFLLRRELVDYGFLNRERDGTRYWRPQEGPALQPPQKKEHNARGGGLTKGAPK